MEDMVLIGLATYGFISLLLFLMEALSWWHRPNPSPLRFILLLKDSEQKVEHVVRSLTWMSWVKGIPVQFIAIDFGSRDDTLSILKRLSRGRWGSEISLHPGGDEEEPQSFLEESGPLPILIDLRNAANRSAW
ncbi:putative Glycosyl transferase family 2 [[Clostridium] ultunense Esp]|nr:putative Glycosyl transferase family 2 [[Clostridium] ultunense Esp]